MENRVNVIKGTVVINGTGAILRGKTTAVNAVRQFSNEPDKKVRFFTFPNVTDSDPNSIMLAVEVDFIEREPKDSITTAFYVSDLPELWESILIHIPNLIGDKYVLSTSAITAYKMSKEQAMSIFDAFLPGYARVRDELFDLKMFNLK